MGKVPEFTKVEDVVEAYEAQGVPAFAIFHDRDMRAKFVPDSDEGMDEGATKLETILTQLQTSGSYAIYTLRTYEDTAKGVKNNTPYDCSVNFQFNRGSSPRAAGVGGVETTYKGASYTDLAVENAILKKELEDLQAEIDEPKEGDGVMGTIDKISQLPGMDRIIGIIAEKIAGLLTRGEQPQQQMEQQPDNGFAGGGYPGTRKISGVPNLDDAKRIDISLSELSKKVPDLADILEKLARMSKNTPFKFNLYISTLRKMNV